MGTWFNGQQDAYWIAFLDFGRLIGVRYEEKLNDGLNIWKNIAADCHWFYPFLDFCIITDKCTEIHRDERGELHNLSGPALSYTDGWSIYAIHGVRLEGWIINHPEQITVDKIENEQNTEIRRVMMERFGYDRYIIESHAELIHQDQCGKLYCKNVPDDEPVVMVNVINSTPEPDGSKKQYWLRVPPDIKTAKAAVAWTFDVKPEEYQPEVES